MGFTMDRDVSSSGFSIKFQIRTCVKKIEVSTTYSNGKFDGGV